MQEEPCRCDMIWGAFILRLSMGLLLLIAGLNKFIGGTDGTLQYIAEKFSDTWLPGWMTMSYAIVLPYAEMVIGALLILGLFRFYAVAMGSALMISLAFGMMVAQQWDTVAHNLIYVAIFAAVAFTAPYDQWKLDRLVFRRP